ncbi:hypothetical protein Tco_0378973 [Tanacetum coccineum]
MTSFGYPNLLTNSTRVSGVGGGEKDPVLLFDGGDLKERLFLECVFSENQTIARQLTLIAPALLSKQYSIPGIDTEKPIVTNPVHPLKGFECLWLHTLMSSIGRMNSNNRSNRQALVNISASCYSVLTKINSTITFFHLFSDEMIVGCECVFRHGVLNVVAAKSYGTLVVHCTEDAIVSKLI